MSRLVYSFALWLAGGLGLFALPAGAATIDPGLAPDGSVFSRRAFEILPPEVGSPQFEDCSALVTEECGSLFTARGIIVLELVHDGPDLVARLDLSAVTIVPPAVAPPPLTNTGQVAVNLFLGLAGLPGMGRPAPTIEATYEFDTGRRFVTEPFEARLPDLGSELRVTGLLDQRFVDGGSSQVDVRARLIPEPGTALLVASGLMGLLLQPRLRGGRRSPGPGPRCDGHAAGPRRRGASL